MKKIFPIILIILIGVEGTHAQSRKWMPIPQEVNDIVWDFAIYKGQLIAGGYFTKAGQTSVNHIAAWDGNKWTPLGKGLRGPYAGAEKMYVHDSLLYVKGFFDSAGEVAARGLAVWNGKEWKNLLKNGLMDTLRKVHSFAVYKNEIYVGGNYSQIGGIKANGIAKWDGENWHSLGTNKYTDAQNLYVFEEELYMLGSIDLGGPYKDYIARWDGTSWKKLSTGVGNQHKGMINWNDKLLIGANTPLQIPPVDYRDLVQWDGDTIIRFSRQLMINLYNFKIFENELYCFGGGGIMKWNEDSLNWNYFDTGIQKSTIRTMVEYEGELYCGGDFDKFTQSNCNYIARYTDKVGIYLTKEKPIIGLYPNPVKTILSIQGIAIDYIVISSLSGQIVMREEINGAENSEIDLGLLSNGLYILELIGKDGNVYREKIVKN